MNPTPRHHIIITGTGRTGTTFLVQLLTELGFDTGFPKGAGVDPNSNAGLERAITDNNAPYIVKQPHLCDNLERVMQSGDYIVDHAIIPRRDMTQAAESRRTNARKSPHHPPSAVTGGTFGTDSLEPGEQEAVLEQKHKNLMESIEKYQIPHTELWFPDDMRDPDKLYEKLRVILGETTKDAFKQAHQSVWKPELVHTY